MWPRPDDVDAAVSVADAVVVATVVDAAVVVGAEDKRAATKCRRNVPNRSVHPSIHPIHPIHLQPSPVHTQPSPAQPDKTLVCASAWVWHDSKSCTECMHPVVFGRMWVGQREREEGST